MNTMILYFSGTGNTEYVVRKIEDILHECNEKTESHSIEDKFELKPDTFDRLILGCPKYYEYPAYLFLNYIKKNLPYSKKTIPVFFFCTQVSPMKTDFRKIEKQLKRKNYKLIVTKSFPIANNMIIFDMFPVTPSEKVNGNLEAIDKSLKPLLDHFLNEKPTKESLSFFMYTICHLCAVVFTKLFAWFAVKYSTSDHCTGCGLCAKKCPVKNISMKKKRPQFHKHCTFCMRCINICPAHAILYKGKERPKYQFLSRKKV